MKRRMSKSKSMNMMGAKPFVKTAKKPEHDDKPHARPGAKSSNKGKTSARTKRLTGLML